MEKRYWVGGPGTWSDTSHWSSSSHGLAGASVPTKDTDVYFDHNSGLSGQTVEITTPVTCHNLSLSVGAAWTWDMSSGGSIYFYGSATLESYVTQPEPGVSRGQLIWAGTTNETLDFAGNTDGIDYFAIEYYGFEDAARGTLTLLSDMTLVRDLYLESGTLDLNGYNFTGVSFETDAYDAFTSATIYLRSGIVTCKFFNIYPDGAFKPVIYAGTSLIRMENVSGLGASPNFNVFDLGTDLGASGYTFYNVYFAEAGTNGNPSILSGSNTFQDIGVAAGHGLLLEQDQTTTLRALFLEGSAGSTVRLGSCEAFAGTEQTGTHTLIKSTSGVVGTCDYAVIQHSIATPANVWYAGVNSTNNQADVSAGSGWTFTDAPLYTNS